MTPLRGGTLSHVQTRGWREWSSWLCSLRRDHFRRLLNPPIIGLAGRGEFYHPIVTTVPVSSVFPLGWSIVLLKWSNLDLRVKSPPLMSILKS